MPYLEQLLRAPGVASGPNAASAEALQLAALLVRDFPADTTTPDPLVARLLDCLRHCGEPALIEQFLLAVPASGVYGGAENDALARAAQCLAPQRAADLIERIVAVNAGFAINAVAGLLLTCSRWRGVAPSLLLPAARILLGALMGRAALADGAERWRWRHLAPVGAEGVRDLLLAFGLLGADDLADAALAHMLSTLDLDHVLLPAALAPANGDGANAALGPLHLAVLQRVRQRIALDLAPPPEWRRSSALACNCADCAALGRFLDDAAAPSWHFAAAQGRRQHIEAAIRAGQCDLGVETVRKGSPHTLMCTKNQASYECRVLQRRQDLEHERLLMAY